MNLHAHVHSITNHNEINEVFFRSTWCSMWVWCCTLKPQRNLNQAFTILSLNKKLLQQLCWQRKLWQKATLLKFCIRYSDPHTLLNLVPLWHDGHGTQARIFLMVLSFEQCVKVAGLLFQIHMSESSEFDGHRTCQFKTSSEPMSRRTHKQGEDYTRFVHMANIRVCLLYLCAKCGSGQSEDCLAQPLDPSFAQQSSDWLVILGLHLIGGAKYGWTTNQSLNCTWSTAWSMDNK